MSGATQASGGAAHTPVARPTTEGTATGTPAVDVAEPGLAAPDSGRPCVVARLDDIPVGEGRAFIAGDTQVVVFRLRDGSVRAVQAACPHAGGPLADGQTDLDVLVCPLHLYAFRWADGRSTTSDLALRQYPAHVLDGDIVVDV